MTGVLARMALSCAVASPVTQVEPVSEGYWAGRFAIGSSSQPLFHSNLPLRRDRTVDRAILVSHRAGRIAAPSVNDAATAAKCRCGGLLQV